MRVARAVWEAFVAVLIFAVPLMGTAALLPGGDAALRRGAWLMAALAAVVLVAKIATALLRPANLETRRRPMVTAKTQPLIDAVGLAAYVVYLMAWFAFLSLDTVRLHLLAAPPAWMSALGLAAAIAGNGMACLAVWQNPFAAPAIEAQDGQRVVDSGLYGTVRHPLYAGNLLFYVGSALWMGSLAALAGVAVMLLATLARVVIEERFLRVNLPGYADYVERVPARLIPYMV